MKVLVLDARQTKFMFFLTGLVAGLASLLILGLPQKWALSLIAGLIIFCLALFQPDLQRYFQVLLVLSIPLATFNYQFFVRRGHFGTPGIAFGLIEVILIIIYGIWFASRPSWEKAKEVFFSRLSLAALVLIAISAFSFYNAQDLGLSTFGLVNLIKVYLIFLYVANNVTETKNLKCIVDFFILALLVQQFLGLAQYLTQSSLGLFSFGESPELLKMAFGGETFVRVAATLVHPNQFANFLGLGLPLALSLLISGQRPSMLRILYTSVFILGLLIFVLTFSRTGWFHIITSTIVVLLLSFWRGKIKKEVTNYVVVGGITAGIFLLFFSNAIFLRLFHSSPVLITARFDMARVAWRMIRAHPLLGIGINNYMKVLPRYDFLGVMPAPVHNLYLLLAAEIGVFGLLAFIALVVLIYQQLGKAITSSNNFVCAVAIGISGGLTGFLVDGLSDFSYILASTQLLFWFLAGLVLALPKINADKEEQNQNTNALSLPSKS